MNFQQTIQILKLFIFCTSYVQASHIHSLEDLNKHIANAQTDQHKSVGFLSEGNYHSHQHELDSSTIGVIYEDTDHMYEALKKGEIVSGLISGVPHNNFTHFNSKIVSLRTMYLNTNRKDKLMIALDRAIVEIQKQGLDYDFASQNQPYELVSTPTCKLETELLPWPNKTEIDFVNDTVRIAALGPYSWGSDGDYKVNPPTGFWVDYYNAIEKQFIEQYNVKFERVWFPGSGGVLGCIEAGDCHASEPYYTVTSAYNDKTRKHHFDMSCSTGGTVPTYFALNDEEEATNYLTVAISMGSVLVLVIPFIGFMIKKEKEGSPIFYKLMPSKSSSCVPV